MNLHKSESRVQAHEPLTTRLATLQNLVLLLGAVAIAFPTMLQVARDSWSTEQGGHGPLVLATGIWAIAREVRSRPLQKHPGNLLLGLPVLALCLGVFVLARITGILEIEAFAMYAAMISAAYLLFGGALLSRTWFPLVYLAFTLPPPNTVVAVVTQPIKIAISSWTVSLLSFLGYPIASSGVTIQIGQYELFIAAACAGLNSIVTLTALCLFYVYLRHRSNPLAFAMIAVAAIPVAVISNFVRVMALVLITYYFGDAAAQGFIHDFAGLLMFAVALIAIFAVDRMVAPLLDRPKKATSA